VQPARRANAWAQWLAATLLLAAACQLDSHVTPLTQVVVDLDSEPQVKARTAEVSLVVSGGQQPDETWSAPPSLKRVIELGQDAGPTWPLRLVLVPRGRDAGRLFAITASAQDSAGNLVAQTRLLSGYVMNEIRYVQLELSDDCQSIVCPVTQTCRAGACFDAARPAASLARFRPSLDAGTPFLDAGSDAQIDSSNVDAACDAGGLAVGTIAACDQDHGGCDPLVTCQNSDGQAVCGACPSGYDDAHHDGTACSDIDECQTNNGGCDAKHGTCVNVPGSRECNCVEGFHGDGLTCAQNPACHDAGDCSSQANCKQQRCVCKAGYAGDGSTCDDIDECQAKPAACGDHATCQNNLGSFQCLCQQGYATADASAGANAQSACVDLDECATHASDCDDDPNACINREGGFDCRCPSGYTGDGKGAGGCSDIDECATNNGGCDPHRTCNNSPGSFACGSCASGYMPSGSTGCANFDPCAMNNGGCDPLRTCKIEDAGVSCGKCQSGYSRDGDTGCVDDDECAKKNGNCGDHRLCQNTSGSFQCGDCEDGFHSDDSGACASNN
jgi:hypothetical protein